ncbi:DNA-binding transcriptional regulator, MarR family [Mesobacillus persicus]|uniref:DNA-binding transcriptional regulator, MarR family n=1 Tax=Mesobacillus persicus TaxID=930146 RepID=A0A1H7VV36_9BACI|nr:MarR family transcriptional regulator [Mesobacillus persicus]SEM12667.1 DNA-binding transcriptional regulator, MarR family [Mesobacillus persicus]
MDLSVKQNTLLMVRALYFCLEEGWAKIGKTFDLTPAQQHILFLLSTNNKSLSPTRISDLGCWHLSTVTRLVRPLESKGYILITTDQSRARYKKVTITNEGMAILMRIVESVKKVDNFPLNLSHLSNEEINQFINIGKKILEIHKGEDFKLKVLEAKLEGLDYA